MMGRNGKLLVLLCSIALIFGMSGVSSGAVYTSDVFSYNGILGAGSGQTPAASFTLSLNGYPTNGTGDPLIGARLHLSLIDDSFIDPAELSLVIMSTDLHTIATISDVNLWGLQTSYMLFDNWIDIPDSLYWYIENDGATPFIIQASKGDFYFCDAKLEATTVPEPGTMMLLGSGLLGLVVWGRKKVRK